MSKLKLSTALGGFSAKNQTTLNCGSFDVTINRATEGNPIFRAALARKRRELAKSRLIASDEYLTGSFQGDVELFCELVLVSWTLKDDDGNAVPIGAAEEVFTGSDAGQELFWKLNRASQIDAVFRSTSEDDDVKNSGRPSEKPPN